MKLFSWLIKPVETPKEPTKPQTKQRGRSGRKPKTLSPDGKVKFCRKCENTKAVQEFNKLLRSPDGLQTYCRDCQARMQKKWYQRNKNLEAQAQRREELRVQSMTFHDVPKSVAGKLHKLAEKRHVTVNALGLEALQAFLILND